MESDSFIQEAAEELKSYAMADIAPAEDAPSGWQWVVEGVGLTQELPGGDGWWWLVMVGGLGVKLNCFEKKLEEDTLREGKNA